MPRACSPDLRERVLAACEAGEGSQAEVARRFRVGERTLSRWLRVARTEGRRGPKVPARKRARSGARRRCWPSWSPSRAMPPWPSTPSGSPSVPVSGVASLRLPGAQVPGPGAEEKTLRAAERDREEVARARAAWRAELAGIDPQRPVFLEESGIDTRLTRAYGRARRGQRVLGKVP